MIEIIKGEKKDFVIIISAPGGARFDFTAYDQYKVCLPASTGNLELTQTPNANGSSVVLNGSPDKGELLVTVNPADSETLKIGKHQEINVEVSSSTDNTLIKRWIIDDSLEVVDFDC
jgi:hypothetical protein